MSNISLKQNTTAGITLLKNSFIDNYMINANGEYVKIYLYILRCLNDAALLSSVSVSMFADVFDCTEKDILRALRYWEKAGLLTLEFSEEGLSSIQINEPEHIVSHSVRQAGSDFARSESFHGTKDNARFQNAEQIDTISNIALYAVTQTDNISNTTIYSTASTSDNINRTAFGMRQAENDTAGSTPSHSVGQNADIMNNVPSHSVGQNADTMNSAPSHSVRQNADAIDHTPHNTGQNADTVDYTPCNTGQNADTADYTALYGAKEDRPQEEKPAYISSGKLAAFADNTEVRQLLYIAQKYMGKTLNETEANTILYFYDNLEFSADLIEYLLEYCASNNKRSFRYIEKTGISWHEAGISTPGQAKEYVSSFSRTYFSVLKAFGISGRKPAPVEQEIIDKWTNQYGFSLDMILEACNRTMNAIHQPNFQYADSILKGWQNKNVYSIADLKPIDSAFEKQKEQTAKIPKTQIVPKKNSFNNIPQHNYDFNELEKALLKRS